MALGLWTGARRWRSGQAAQWLRGHEEVSASIVGLAHFPTAARRARFSVAPPCPQALRLILCSVERGGARETRERCESASRPWPPGGESREGSPYESDELDVASCCGVRIADGVGARSAPTDPEWQCLTDLQGSYLGRRRPVRDESCRTRAAAPGVRAVFIDAIGARSLASRAARRKTPERGAWRARCARSRAKGACEAFSMSRAPW